MNEATLTSKETFFLSLELIYKIPNKISLKENLANEQLVPTRLFIGY